MTIVNPFKFPEHRNTPTIWDACYYCGVSLDGGCPPEEWDEFCKGWTPELEEQRAEEIRKYVERWERK